MNLTLLSSGTLFTQFRHNVVLVSRAIWQNRGILLEPSQYIAVGLNHSSSLINITTARKWWKCRYRSLFLFFFAFTRVLREKDTLLKINALRKQKLAPSDCLHLEFFYKTEALMSRD